ncbi:Alkaline phosphatase synthesis transcriptional regulatory protein PhoP [Planctomycetales bacterium 10988]|nr:Alkaline phosphatase synthesis transcriptional regulatory protein PhoP [Planctomycetales bacterium 10988]
MKSTTDVAKILIVDDSPTQLTVAVESLKRGDGFEILTARNGEDALRVISEQTPDLIVLDVVLPQKNGFQVCRQLKSSPTTKGIKVVLLTSRNQKSDRFWGLKQGADLYMTKPYNEDDLLDSVRQLL